MNTPNEDLKKVPATKPADNHPIGTALGATGGLAAGAALGSALGPLGTAAGAVIGTVFGAFAGKGIAEGIDPIAEETHWKSEYRDQPEYKSDFSFDDYGPAYRLGWQLYAPGATFEAVEKDIDSRWETEKGTSRLSRDEALEAARAGWNRVEKSQRPVG